MTGLMIGNRATMWNFQSNTKVHTVSEYRYATHDEAGIRKEEKTEYKEINLSAKSYKTDCRTDINSCRGGCGSEHHRDNDYTGEDSKAIVAILEHDCLF